MCSEQGKFAINTFVLITGYFMCTRKVEHSDIIRKWFKLLLQNAAETAGSFASDVYYFFCVLL